CGGHCADLKNDFNNCGACGNVCPGTAPYCIEGHCVCPASEDFEVCGDSCVYLPSDPFHCGACGNICPGGEFCAQGVCRECGPGLTLCGIFCVDLLWDQYNC